jgi:hypothetical protein
MPRGDVRASEEPDEPSKFTSWRLICRLVLWLLGILFVLTGGFCMCVAVIPDNGFGGRYRGRAQILARLFALLALLCFHLGIIVYGTGYL